MNKKSEENTKFRIKIITWFKLRVEKMRKRYFLSQVQVRKACKADIPQIKEIMIPLEQKRVLLKRTDGYLEENIEKFCVAERNGEILACCTFEQLEKDVFELRAVCALSKHRKKGITTKLFKKAMPAGTKIIYALSINEGWFLKNNFIQIMLNMIKGNEGYKFKFDERIRKRKSLKLFKYEIAWINRCLRMVIYGSVS